jgi:hypothetical protein
MDDKMLLQIEKASRETLEKLETIELRRLTVSVAGLQANFKLILLLVEEIRNERNR